MSHFKTLSYFKTKDVEVLYSKKTIFVTELSCDIILVSQSFQSRLPDTFFLEAT